MRHNLDRDDIINEIDQLIATAIEEHIFGRDSKTAQALRRAYDTACAEAKEIEQDGGETLEQHDAMSAQLNRSAEARAINEGRV